MRRRPSQQKIHNNNREAVAAKKFENSTKLLQEKLALVMSCLCVRTCNLSRAEGREV